MTNEAKMIELSNEAKTLLMEFYEAQRVLCDGENVLEYIKSTKDGRQITLKQIDCEEEEYDLPCIASTLRYDLRGIGPCGSGFYEALDLAKADVEDEYKNMNKDEYIQYVGGLFYLGERAEEIYARLQEIEKETEEIW